MSIIEWLVIIAIVLTLVVICIIVLASLRIATGSDKAARKAFEKKFGGEE